MSPPPAPSSPLSELLPAAVVVVLGYGLTLGLSGFWVRFFCRRPHDPASPPPSESGPRFDSSAVIGKCENILAVTFILAGEATGLALIIAAKSLVRSEQIRKDAGFYLGGTLVNLVWSVLMGYATRTALKLVNGGF